MLSQHSLLQSGLGRTWDLGAQEPLSWMWKSYPAQLQMKLILSIPSIPSPAQTGQHSLNSCWGHFFYPLKCFRNRVSLTSCSLPCRLSHIHRFIVPGAVLALIRIFLFSLAERLRVVSSGARFLAIRWSIQQERRESCLPGLSASPYPQSV